MTIRAIEAEEVENDCSLFGVNDLPDAQERFATGHFEQFRGSRIRSGGIDLFIGISQFHVVLLLQYGKTETILSVPVYNWHWQPWYNLADSIDLSQDTKIECTAHFDNSPNSPENPDPTKAVIWGQQSWDEMMVGFFNLRFAAAMPANEISSPGAPHLH